jgi:hypothetical protein
MRRALHAIGQQIEAPGIRERFAPCGFGQRWSLVCSWCVTPGIANTLRALCVYEDFDSMCDMFVAEGCSDLDGTVVKWLRLGMPILTRTGSGDARHMHAQAHQATSSPRVLQRASTPGRLVMHWVVSQVGAAYPATEHQRTQFLRELGLVVQHGTVQSRAKCEPDCLTAPAPRSLSTYPIRMMMNPSLHVKAWKESGLALPDEFLRHEVACIQDNVQGVMAFSEACVRSPLYGRMYLKLYDKYGFGCNASGMLPKEGPEQVWRVDWGPVSRLCTHSSSSLVILGCGGARYWQRALPGRQSYLHEVNLASLKALALLELPDTTHIVPTTCCTQKGRVVVASMSWPMPTMAGRAHYANGSTGEWEHTANCSTAAVEFAHKMYVQM